ncbi:MAG: hypothetical protein MAG451_00084 [Anaerolineales bacterium]|nr:hypothetical protein [Anaerolineales bacterium]
MLFSAASFTVSTVGTIVSVIGIIRTSDAENPRIARVGWLLLFAVVASYLLGIFALLSPSVGLPGVLPTTSILPAALAVVVGAIGTLNCSYLAAVRQWRGWALAGVALIPVLTIGGVAYYVIR